MKIFYMPLAIWKIGIYNVFLAISYKILKNLGFHPSTFIKSETKGSLFFNKPLQSNLELKYFSEDILNYHNVFGWYPVNLSNKPPLWHENPFNKIIVDKYLEDWWKLPDFGLNIGDIKTVWELSRFDWIVNFALRARCGDESFIKKSNLWIKNWCENNPPYLGVNWKCAQEASIRLIHIAMASKILDQKEMLGDLKSFVIVHLKRIESTLSYAISQQNNHATSEAAALYIGGTWCKINSVERGSKWAKKGKNLLEKSIKNLIMSDGSFSQYSTNYHRLLLDTLSMVELWRRWVRDDRFSEEFYHKSKLATIWLFSMVNPKNGHAPNIGANDGANLFSCLKKDFLDFRSSVQLSSVLFHNSVAYKNMGKFDFILDVNKITKPSQKLKVNKSQNFPMGGFAVLKNLRIMVVVKYANYNFRPKQSDVLHMDVWIDGINIFMDGGSYRYNTSSKLYNYFSGASSHNTIEFDGRDQMPKISRFLRGAWPESKNVSFHYSSECSYFSAEYTDYKKAFHRRSINIDFNQIIVSDKVTGFDKIAILRWRLIPEVWTLENNILKSKYCSVTFKSDSPIENIKMVDGWDSKFYYKKISIKVLELRINQPGTIKTYINFF